MKNMVNQCKYRNIINKEYDKESCNGAVLLVEATIVFPIVFFVIFFIICIGNSYFVKSYMQKVADNNAIIAANYARTEYLMDVNENKVSIMDMDLNPYQMKTSDKVKQHMNGIIDREAKSKSCTIFKSMAPTGISSGSQSDYAVFVNGFFESYVNVEIKYTLNLIPLFDNFGIGSVDCTAKATARINNNTSFIRNADMLKDVFVDFLQTEKGKEISGKIKGKIEEITSGLKKFLNIFK